MTGFAKATPRPWRLNEYGSIGAGAMGTYPVIASVWAFFGPDRKHGNHIANARLIVTAVNLHNDLLATLAALVEEIEAGAISQGTGITPGQRITRADPYEGGPDAS